MTVHWYITAGHAASRSSHGFDFSSGLRRIYALLEARGEACVGLVIALANILLATPRAPQICFILDFSGGRLMESLTFAIYKAKLVLSPIPRISGNLMVPVVLCVTLLCHSSPVRPRRSAMLLLIFLVVANFLLVFYLRDLVLKARRFIQRR